MQCLIFNLNYFFIRYKIDWNVEEGVFLLSFGLKICVGDCFLDEYFLQDIKIFIFLCGEFVFLGIIKYINERKYYLVIINQ